MMEKVILTVPTGIVPKQIDAFPKDIKRATKGTIHVRPGTMSVSKDEAKLIIDLYPGLEKRFIIVKVRGKAPQPEVPNPVVEYEPEEAVEPEAPREQPKGRKNSKNK